VSEPFYLGAYWGPRKEAVASCADRLAACLSGLARASELVGTWYLKANRKSEMTKAPVSIEPEALATLLQAGQNRRDVDREPILELGFSVAMWNGDYKRAVGMSVKCGAWSTVVPNSFVLSLPSIDDGAAELYAPDVAQELIRSVVTAWEPEWATFTSHSLREAQQLAPGAPVLGWATYLASRDGVSEPQVPSGVSSEPLGAGVLVRVGQDPMQLSEPVLLAARGALNLMGR